MLKPVHTQLLACLHREACLSRAQLHRRTGVRPNTVGQAVDELLAAGLLRLGAVRTEGRGPRHENVEIDASQRYVAGLAIAPGRVQACRLSLTGKPLGPIRHCRRSSTSQLLAQAAILAQQIAESRRCIGLGVSIPGFIDRDASRVTTSSVFPGQTDIDLQPICGAAPGVPATLDSQIHAVSTRWLLSERQVPDQAVLLVSLADGEVGASLLIDGKPCSGSLRAGNELGHTQLPVDTARCYCGQVGCVERIFSNAYFQQQRRGQQRVTLLQAVARFGAQRDKALAQMTELLAMAIGNAVNFARPNRLVLAGDLVRHAAFADELTRHVRDRIFGELVKRMQIQVWPDDCAATAETAAWLALSRVFGLRA